jgi:lysophospholipase L1-like esterase
MKIGKPRRILSLVLTFVWVQAALAIPLPGPKPSENTPALSDDLFCIYKNIEEEMAPNGVGMSFLPLVKKDRQGRAWKAWEEWGKSRSDIRLGQFKMGKLVLPQTVSRQAGFNYSPDFSFDHTDSPWMIWINDLHQEHRIFVEDVSSRRTWQLNSRSRGTITSPKIIIGPDNTVWAFWNETLGRKGGIFYRVLDQRGWSPLRRIPQEIDFPPLNPDAAADAHGNLWVAWSRYDGNDYEIYLSCWTGQAWMKETRISDNKENDVFPAIQVEPEGKLLLSWTQSSGRGNQVCLKWLKGGASGQEIKISPADGGMAVSRIFREGERIGIVWKSADGIKIREFTPPLPAEVSSLPSPSHSPHPLYNPSFNENEYAGVGDSITYGYIDRLPAPELGYIPRLNAVLNQNFGPSRVLNEGVPGETTYGGLSRIDNVISANATRYILIMEGTNDVITGGLSMDTSAFNLSEMIRKCLEAGAFPAIATILPRRDWLWDIDIVRENHLYLVELIREVAAAFQVPLVDQYELFLNYPSPDGGLLSLLSNDLLHPSEKGYQFMAESWFAEIRNFPFPPVDVELRGRSPEGATSSQKKGPTSRLAGRKGALPLFGAPGNLLTWKDNPKIFDEARIKGYNIYRKNSGVPGGSFRFRAFVPETSRFFDSGTNVLKGFVYVISTVRDDGIEGPASEPVDK